MAGASGATERRLAPADAGALRLRVLSALVLAPVALAAIWLGGRYLQALTVVAALVMAWEWARLCHGGAFLVSGFAAILASVGAVVAAIWGGVLAGSIFAATGALLVFAISRGSREQAAHWLAGGVLWVALPCVILLWLAHSTRAGREMLLWLFAIVWATDIGAYAFGRRFGGPLLAPRWSPRKTWA